MINDLKERYIYAVTRHLPVKMQADVAKELDGLITEMIEEQFSNRTHNEEDIEGVLAELGAPEELALKYCGDERKALISGTYFLMYKRILYLVLPIVVAVVAVTSILGIIFDAGGLINVSIPFVGISITTVTGGIWQIIANTFGAAIQTFAVITIIFAIMDYSKTKIGSGKDMSASLPDVPEASTRIHPAESIFGIVVSIAAAVGFLGYPHIFAGNFNGIWVPVFDIEILQSLWLPFVLLAVFGVGAELTTLIEGRYTLRLAVVTTIANFVIALCVIAIFSSSDILNPEFISSMENIFPQINIGWLNEGIANINMVILVIVLISLAAEAVYMIARAFLARR